MDDSLQQEKEPSSDRRPTAVSSSRSLQPSIDVDNEVNNRDKQDADMLPTPAMPCSFGWVSQTAGSTRTGCIHYPGFLPQMMQSSPTLLQSGPTLTMPEASVDNSHTWPAQINPTQDLSGVLDAGNLSHLMLWASQGTRYKSPTNLLAQTALDPQSGLRVPPVFMGGERSKGGRMAPMQLQKPSCSEPRHPHRSTEAQPPKFCGSSPPAAPPDATVLPIHVIHSSQRVGTASEPPSGNISWLGAPSTWPPGHPASGILPQEDNSVLGYAGSLFPADKLPPPSVSKEWPRIDAGLEASEPPRAVSMRTCALLYILCLLSAFHCVLLIW
jgi:hypothetical protein